MKLTESINPKTLDIDCKSIEEIISIMNEEDKNVIKAVQDEKDNIVKVVESVIYSLSNGGRLFYVGAGTSGRLGVLDAAECPPTFGTKPEMVQGIIAGGNKALTIAVEGAEDDEEKGSQVILEQRVNNKDIVIGITTSGTTPYVIAALKQSHLMGAKTVLLSCNPLSKKKTYIDYYITPLVGPEIITGSTRLKAGTATKMILNMITTTSMIKLGKVYKNLMVDLQANNQKLKKRSINIIKILTNLEDEKAIELLKQAKGNLKIALVMYLKKVDYNTALNHLKINNYILRKALET